MFLTILVLHSMSGRLAVFLFSDNKPVAAFAADFSKMQVLQGLIF